MEPRDPAYREQVSRIFDQAAHVREVGIVLNDLGPGWCETQLAVQPKHLQQTYVVHAGVLATLADHTAGAAASTLLPAEAFVLSVEFKINLLRAARGPKLWCRAQVLKAGRRIFVVESEVFSTSDADTKLVAKATVTLAVLKREPSNPDS
ncbi:MAG TPA: PaaI family thioesterase [Rhodothermales bacterium]|nr:PaaI family thioesterase [Rhodothermales bacterium]